MLLRIVQLLQRAGLGHAETLDIQENGSGHERSGQRSTPRLVGAGHEAIAEAAIVRDKPGPAGLAATPLLRAPRRSLKMTVRRPIGGEGRSDDPRFGDRSPEPAVVGLPTVVTHHEPVSGRNLDRERQVAGGAGVVSQVSLMKGSSASLPLRITRPLR